MPQRSSVRPSCTLDTASLSTAIPRQSGAASPLMGPKPQRATSGPTVGSNSPPLAPASERAAEVTRTSSAGIGMVPALARLKRVTSLSMRHGDICMSIAASICSIGARSGSMSISAGTEMLHSVAKARPAMVRTAGAPRASRGMAKASAEPPPRARKARRFSLEVAALMVQIPKSSLKIESRSTPSRSSMANTADIITGGPQR